MPITVVKNTGITAEQVSAVFNATAKDNVVNGLDGHLIDEVLSGSGGPNLMFEIEKNGYNSVDFLAGVEVGYNLAFSTQQEK